MNCYEYLVPGEQYLYFDRETILHLPDFQQITCEQNYTDPYDYDAVAGLLTLDGKDRLIVCRGSYGTGCLIWTENGWQDTNPEFDRYICLAYT